MYMYTYNVRSSKQTLGFGPAQVRKDLPTSFETRLPATSEAGIQVHEAASKKQGFSYESKGLL